MNFDWPNPLVIDWSGRRGPLISEDDIKNSVIKRILRNQYYGPYCERERNPVKPWWNPPDPFGNNFANNTFKFNKFIPGLHRTPLYPQLSTLTKQQHQQGVRVLSAKYKNVQPTDYRQPKQQDYLAFEDQEMVNLYEAEKKEYQKWAKRLWINGDCVRALRPKPTIERVYEAEFKMKAHRIQSLPQKYAMAAQIPLGTKNNEVDFELEYNGDLIDVNIDELPFVEYPVEIESDFSILLKSCPVPEPCDEHPCNFVLPNEDSVSVLPLTEINRELAEYAIENGVNIVASENALHCLLETERNWKLTVSVVEVKCPRNGDIQTVVVLGSEFSVQKECSTQRSYKAYKHLLRHTFVPSYSGYSKLKTSKQPTTSEQAISKPTAIENPIVSNIQELLPLDDGVVYSDEEDINKLLIDDKEPNSEPKEVYCPPLRGKLLIEPNIDNLEPNNEPEFIDFNGEPSSEPDLLLIDDNTEFDIATNYGLNSCEPIYDNYKPAMSSYSNNEPFRKSDRLMINEHAIKANPEPSYSQGCYNYKCDAYKAKPNPSDEPNSEPDQLRIDEENSVGCYHCPPTFYDTSENINVTKISVDNLRELSKPESNRELDQLMTYESDYSNDTSDSEPENVTKISVDNLRELSYSKPDTSKPGSNSALDQLIIYEPSYSKNTSDSEPENVTNKSSNNISELILGPPESDLNQLMIYEPNYSNDTSDSEPENVTNKSSSNISELILRKPESNGELDQLMIYKPNYSNDASDSKPKTDTNKLSNNIELNSSKPVSNSESDQLMIYEPDYSNDTSDSEPENVTNQSSNNFNELILEKPESNSEPDHLMIYEPNYSNDASDSEPKTVNNKLSNNIELNSSKPVSDSEPDQPMVYESNHSNNANESEPESDPGISELGKSDTSKPCVRILETYEYNASCKMNTNEDLVSKLSEQNEIAASQLFETNNNADLSSFETNKDATSLLETNNDIAPSLLETHDDDINQFETNETAGPSVFETTKDNAKDADPSVFEAHENATNQFETNKVAVPSLFETNINAASCIVERNAPQARISELTLNANNQMTCEVNNQDTCGVSLKTSPIKPCSIRVRNLSISEAEAYNLIGLFNKPNTTNTDEPAIKQSVDVFEVNDIQNSNKNPLTRLGISGVITKNRATNKPINIVKKPMTLEKINVTAVSSSNQAKKLRANDHVTSEACKNILGQIVTRKRSISGTKTKYNINECTSMHTTNTSPLSPTKPCSITVEPINIEPYVRRLSFNFTNTDENTAKSSEVKGIVNTLTRKRRISRIENKATKIIESIDHANNNNSKSNARKTKRTYTSDAAEENEHTGETTTHPNKSPQKLSFKNSSEFRPSKSKAKTDQNSILKCFETETMSKTSDNGKEPDAQLSTDKKARKLSDQINNEHESGQFQSEIYVTPDSEFMNVCFDEGTDNKVTSTAAAKSKPRKINLEELFGEDSDTDEPIGNTTQSEVNANNDNSMLGTPQLELGRNYSNLDSIDTITKPYNKIVSLDNDNLGNIKTSPVKSGLRSASINVSPRNNKRKLSFSDPELSTGFTDPDSEEAIAGFHNGVAVPCTNLAKDPKKMKEIASGKYGLRPRNKPKQTTNASKNKTTEDTTETSRVVNKTAPKSNKHNQKANKKFKLPSLRRFIHSDTDETEDSDNSQVSNFSTNLKVNVQNKTEKSLRRSRRITRKHDEEKEDVPHEIVNKTAKTNFKDISEKTGCVRRSRCISVRASINEKQPQSKPETNKITKQDKVRRISLPASIFLKSDTTNQVNHSHSLMNVNEIAKSEKAKKSSKPSNKITKQSLQLSERTKRYLRRKFNMNGSCSDTDESEMPERTKKNNRPSIPSVSTKTSDTELQRVRRCSLRSNSNSPRVANNSKRRACLNGGTSDAALSERTRRHLRRSVISAQSSCDEPDQLNIIKKGKTRQPQAMEHTANKIDLSPTTATKDLNQSETIQLKAGAMDTSRSSSEPTSKNNGIETIEVEIVLREEINDSINNKAEIDVCEKLATEMEVSDSDTEFYDIKSNMCDVNESNRVDHTNSNNTIKTLIDQTQKENQEYQKKITSNQAVKPRNKSVSDTDSSDYFDMDDTEEMNIFHFTATNETNTEESEIEDTGTDARTVDNSQPDILNSNASGITKNSTVEELNTDDNKSEINQTKRLKYTVSETEMLTETENAVKESNRGVKRDSCLTGLHLESQYKLPDINSLTKDAINNIIGVYNCRCKGTQFETPPPRSYKKLRVRNKSSHVAIDLIVHSSHKTRNGEGEVVLEPIVEYQPELGASAQPPGRVRSLALSLLLRHYAQLINVRVDHDNGNVIVIDNLTYGDFMERHGDQKSDIADTLHTSLNQLRFLMPGQYVLAHDMSHGTHAMLYTRRGAGAGAGGAGALQLRADNTNMPDAEDALHARLPPALSAALLPYHKHKSILPLAFTPVPRLVREDRKAPPALCKTKHPPRSIQYAKKKKKSKKARQNRAANASHAQSYE